MLFYFLEECCLCIPVLFLGRSPGCYVLLSGDLYYFEECCLNAIAGSFLEARCLMVGVKGATPLFLFTSGNDKLNCLKEAPNTYPVIKRNS